MAQELSPEQLRRTFDPLTLGCQTTEELQPLEGIIGQKRAVSALHFGLGIQERGFNIYVAGPPGIGKMTTIQSFIEELARKKEKPTDWCYVNNFDDPYQPRALKLPAGRGKKFQHDIESLIDHARRDVPRGFESEEYSVKRDEIVKDLDRQKIRVRERLEEKAAEKGLALEATPLGIAVIPVSGGKPLKESEFQTLPPHEREAYQANREALQDEMKAAMKEVRDLDRAAREKVQELDRQLALNVVGGLIDDLVEKYNGLREVVAHIRAIQSEIVESIELFKTGGASAAAAQAEAGMPPAPWQTDLPFRRFYVNLFVDNSRQEGAPVVVELNPAYNTLFGRVEKETHFGALYTDFMMIRPGSIHHANGGYLVLPAEDLLRNLLAWDGLKRALRGRQVEIEDIGERLGYLTTKTLRPAPIPLDVKVVIVGRSYWYHLLHSYDEEFPELFKVKAEFDTRTPLNQESTRDFLSFLCTFSKKQSLKHLDAGALAAVLEHATRLAEDQEKLSTHFGALADLVREADYWAEQAGSARIGAVHVKRALEEKVYRSNLIQERLQEATERGMILIGTGDRVVGQVNGLSVISLGDYQFGKPARITSTVGPGRGTIVDIEREVELGGPIHSKGVLILNGFLTGRFAQERPLTLSARIVFEQSYEGVDGDSASSTELYAILSALSGAPIRQGIAVTGSVNQRGEVQAIGGVNDKIEGFFDLCKARGFTRDQGVLIPRSNVPHLMLREDVVEAVRAGKFHVWPAGTVDEGIEVLTGVPAGERGADGAWPEGSINFLVDRRLRAYTETLRKLGVTSEAERRQKQEPSDA